jgi:hypothetical protein
VSHLWLHNGRYPDWITDDVFKLRLCEMFHCLPSQLDGEDYETLLILRQIQAAEQKYQKADADARAKLRG